MFKLVASCALFAVACANTDISTDKDGNINMNTEVNADLVLNRRTQETIRISDMMNDITEAKGDISSMKENAAVYTSAQKFMSKLAGDSIDATRTIAVAQAVQAGVLDSMKSSVESQISMISGTVDKQLLDAKATADAATKKAADDAAAAIVTQANALTAAKADIAKSTKTQIDAVSKNMMYMPQKTYRLIDWMAGAANTKAQGRVFYKVDFNPSNAGYFNCDRRQLIQACTDLSKDLKAMDNIDRALKPACDHPSFCGSKGVKLDGSYLSNYGTCSRKVAVAGYGMPLSFTGGVLMYNRENSWNRCQMLMNRGVNCDHAWTDYRHYSTQKASATLCTSSNSNFKKGPQ